MLFGKKKESVACMIDDRFIRFFHVAKDGKKVTLKNYFSERIPDELFDRDHILRADGMFASRLADVRRKYGISKIHLIVPDRYVTVFHTSIPHAALVQGKKTFQRELESYLESLIKNHPEFSHRDMIADYDLVDQSADGYDVHVAVARPEQFSHIPELFESAGFVIDHVDISSFSIHRLAKHIIRDDMYGTISLGTHTTNISVIKSGNIIASTWVPVGSENLMQTLQDTLDISYAEAQTIIQQYGILHTHPDKQVLGALFATMKPIIQGMEQVQESCSEKTYAHKYYQAAPERFYLYGIGASISGIAQYIGIKCNTRVKSIDIIPTEFIDEEILLQIPVEMLPMYLPVMSTAMHYLVE